MIKYITLKKVFLIMLITLILPSLSFSFNITDIEIELNLNNRLKKHRTFIIDCGKKENFFINNGINFSIFRKNDDGILNHIGLLETISVGGITCKAKIKKVSASLKNRTLGIDNIAIGDIANPSITLKITDLLKKTHSEMLSKRGEKNIKEKIMPMINTGDFKQIQIFTFSKSKSSKLKSSTSSFCSDIFFSSSLEE